VLETRFPARWRNIDKARPGLQIRGQVINNCLISVAMLPLYANHGILTTPENKVFEVDCSGHKRASAAGISYPSTHHHLSLYMPSSGLFSPINRSRHSRSSSQLCFCCSCSTYLKLQNFVLNPFPISIHSQGICYFLLAAFELLPSLRRQTTMTDRPT
jgi:hypothetical protein